MLTDLDKLYIAMAEVDAAHLFNMFCYSLNIKSLNALEDYDSRDSIIMYPSEIDTLKKKVANKYFNFKVLTKKVAFCCMWLLFSRCQNIFHCMARMF